MIRKVIAAIPALALVVVLLATPFIGVTTATKPTSVLFGAPFYSFQSASPPEYRQNGPNWVSHGSVTLDLIGDVVGEMKPSDAYWIYRDWIGPEEDPTMLTAAAIHGHVEFTVDPATVAGKTGTLTIKFNDVIAGTAGGTWVIIGGTGELKSLHGHGTWRSPDFIDGIPCQVFEGQIHFDP